MARKCKTINLEYKEMIQYQIPKLDPKVYLKPRGGKVIENKAQEISNETPIVPIITGVKAYPQIQGVELYYQNIPYPRKGFPDEDILNALNIVKRDTRLLIDGFASKYFILEFLVFSLLPWKIKKINQFTTAYVRKANYWLEFWYYLPGYYCVFAKEFQLLVYFFFKELRIKNAWELSWIFTLFVEHDDAYRVRMQDLFSSITQEEMLKNPIKTIQKIIDLFVIRDTQGTVSVKIVPALKILSFILIFPKYRKAFKKAIRLINWKKLQFDDGDRYWGLTWQHWDTQGESWEVRRTKLEEIHKGMSIPMVNKFVS